MNIWKIWHYRVQTGPLVLCGGLVLVSWKLTGVILFIFIFYYYLKNLKIQIESISEDELTVIIKKNIKENLKCTKSLSIKNTYSCDQCEYKTKRKKYLPRHIKSIHSIYDLGKDIFKSTLTTRISNIFMHRFNVCL